ncbi:MAG: hypothetical protein R6W70_01985 [bacterium]
MSMVAVQHDEHMKAQYEKHRTKGKSKLSAYGIIMHKLLRIVFGVLKSGKPYNGKQSMSHSRKAKKGAGSMTAETHHTTVLQPVNMKGKNDTTFT